MPGTVTQQFGSEPKRVDPQNVDFLQTYPDVIRAGGAYRVSPALELRADALWVRWSAFKSQCVVNRGTDCAVDDKGADKSASGSDVILNIPRKWKDTFGARVGAGYFASDALEVFGSVAFNTSPVPKETIDVTSYDSFRLYFTAGARYAISKELHVAGSYTQLYFAPLDTNGASTVYKDYTSPSRSPSADGKYSSWVGLVNVNLGYDF